MFSDACSPILLADGVCSLLSDSANVLIGDTSTYESHPADAGWGFSLFFAGPELLVTAWYLDYDETFESTITVIGHNIGEYYICHEGCSIRLFLVIVEEDHMTEYLYYCIDHGRLLTYARDSMLLKSQFRFHRPA